MIVSEAYFNYKMDFVVVPSAAIVLTYTSINTFINGFFQPVQYHICNADRKHPHPFAAALTPRRMAEFLHVESLSDAEIILPHFH